MNISNPQYTGTDLLRIFTKCYVNQRLRMAWRCSDLSSMLHSRFCTKWWLYRTV